MRVIKNKKFRKVCEYLQIWRIRFYWPTEKYSWRLRITNLKTNKVCEISLDDVDFINYCEKFNFDNNIDNFPDYLSYILGKNLKFWFYDKQVLYFGF